MSARSTPPPTTPPGSVPVHRLLPWRRALPSPRLRLFCFGQVGGTAALFRSWQDRVAPGLEVCAVELAGRGTRMSEPPATRIADVVPILADTFASLADRPWGFFGHSLGGLVAFELARELRRRGQATPRFLVVAASAPPPEHVALAARIRKLGDLEGSLGEASDEELTRGLRHLGGSPAHVLADVDLMRMLLPPVRSDFAMLESYAPIAEARLAFPITVLSGSADRLVSGDQMLGWQQHTEAAFTAEHVNGDHFFPQTEPSSVLTHIARLSADVGAQPEGSAR